MATGMYACIVLVMAEPWDKTALPDSPPERSLHSECTVSFKIAKQLASKETGKKITWEASTEEDRLNGAVIEGTASGKVVAVVRTIPIQWKEVSG